MEYPDVYRISEKLDVVTRQEVDRYEAQLGLTFPPGYRAYVTELGAGYYCDLVEVLLPHQVATQTERRRAEWPELVPYACSEGMEDLSLEALQGSFIIATTNVGDELLFHPELSWIVLPHEQERIYRLGGSLPEVLRWVYDSGNLVTRTVSAVAAPDGSPVPGTMRYFESHADRSSIRYHSLPDRAGRAVLDFVGAFAAAAPEGRRYLVESFSGRIDDPDLIRVFIKDCYGYVCFISRAADEGGSEVLISYDAQRPASSMAPVLSYLDALGGRRSDSAPADTGVVWDRHQRDWVWLE